MGKVQQDFAEGKPICVGIDVHKKDWSVHVVCEGEEIYHATLPPDPGRLIQFFGNNRPGDRFVCPLLYPSCEAFDFRVKNIMSRDFGEGIFEILVDVFRARPVASLSS